MFLYLASVVPSIWLIELDKLDTRIQQKSELNNLEEEVEEILLQEETGNFNSLPIVNNSVIVTYSSPSPIPSAAKLESSPLPVDLDVLKDAGVSLLKNEVATISFFNNRMGTRRIGSWEGCL